MKEFLNVIKKAALVISIMICGILLFILVLGLFYLKEQDNIETAVRQNQNALPAVTESVSKSIIEADTELISVIVSEETALAEHEMPADEKTDTELPETVGTESLLPVGFFSGENGTTSANLFNGGYIATDGMFQYFKGAGGYLYAGPMDDSYAECLLKKSVWYINVQDDWIYFKNDTDKCMARLRTDGTDYQVLYNGDIHELNVHGDQIFYGTDTEVRCMNVDGSNDICLVSGTVWYLNVTDEALYFCLVGDTRSLCRCNLNGSGFITILPSQVYDVMAYGNQIYYTYGKDERYLYAMDRITFESRQLNDQYTRWINADDHFIYYTNYEGYTADGVGYGNALYRVSFDGTITKQTFSDIIKGICIQNGKLYYTDLDDSCKSLVLN